MTFDVYSMPTNGTLTGQLAGINPTMTYTPGLDWYGTDSFTFHVTDAQGNQGTGTITINVLNSISPLADSDGDGLLDLDELNQHGTNPNLADTDADGFDDFTEVVTYGFNASVNNFRFNPLIADTPEIDIRMVSVPDVMINYTLTDGTSSTVATARSQGSSHTVGSTQSESESTSFAQSHSMGGSVSTTVEASASVGLFSPPKAEVSASVTAEVNYNFESTTTSEHSTSWTQTQTQENSRTYEESQSFESSHSVAASDGEISVAVNITNNGHVTYTLNNLYLSATYLRGGDNALVPIGNLPFDAANGAFPASTLAPGQSTGTLVFRTTGVNLEKVKQILSRSQGFSVRPTLYNLLDANNQSYNFAATGITSTDAMIIVDYNGNRGLSNIKKMVAVRGKPNASVTMAEALNNILKINAVTTTNVDGYTYINAVTGLTNRDPYGNWVLLHARQVGNNQTETTIYTTPADAARWKARNPNVANLVFDYDPAGLILNGGDILHVVYLQDEDLDGLSDRVEYFYHSDPFNPDTDGDGLKDGVEVNDGWDVAYRNASGVDIYTHVYSDPSLADTDGDLVDDYSEANFAGVNDWYSRDPRNFDTDGDGLDDSIDDRAYLNPGFGSFLANEFDDLGLSALDAYADVTGTIYGDAQGNPYLGPPNRAFYDVYASFDLPAILQTASPLAQGLTNYDVLTLRSIADNNGSFPDAPVLQDGQPYVVGQLLPPSGFNGPCTVSVCWEVVDVYSAPVDGTLARLRLSLADPRKIGEQVVTGNQVTTPADGFQYLQFVGVNGHYTQQLQTATASPNVETVEFHMLNASLNNVRTMFPVDGLNAVTTYFSWANGGRLTEWNYAYDMGGGYAAYYATDFVTRQQVAPYPYQMPFMNSRGNVQLWWSLGVDGRALSNQAGPRVIQDSYHQHYWLGSSNIPSARATDVAQSNTLDPNTYQPLFSRDNDVAGNEIPVPLDPYSGGYVYKVTLPAVAGCHTVEFAAKSFDSIQNRYNMGQARLTSDPANFDRIELCRDEFGIWSATNVIASDQNSPLRRPSLGYFTSNVTTQNNTNPIHYVSDVMQWGDDSTVKFDLQIEYEIYIR
ncbi:MAG: hypothetical protein D6794_03170 [Deltaproteobacteria bacterium]|nr:MAG: hypothetical protein D6794_03170 [Deltaproteobacteria bacterium]